MSRPSRNPAGSIALLVALLAPAALFAQANIGPDVIVGDLAFDIEPFGSENGIYAYAIGTESCNVGDELLAWVASTPEHPVIGQELYRLKNGVLEQVGISWLKHSFCALSLDLCASCPVPTGCESLGIGCSDPYSAGLNGAQGNLGPRSQVNAHTGVFQYPFSAPPFSGVIARRLQVHQADIDPAQNVGALYFATSHYVTQDDAMEGNGNNNASYRRVQVGTNPATFPLSTVPGQGTQQQSPGIQAWQDQVPTVVLEDVQVQNEGLFIVGHHVTDNGNGTWHYEYAVYNMNSDRSAGSFQVQFPGLASVTNIGFHDVDHHSGEPYSGTDWQGTYSPGTGVTWSTASYGSNPNANAIRWSTMYNFRFDANVPPAPGPAILGLFKPGTPSVVSVNVNVPAGSTVPAITGLSCVPGNGQVDLAWSNGASYDAVEVRRDGSVVATLAGTATSYADPGVAPGSHTWDVRGVQGTDASFPALCSAVVTLRILALDDASAFAGQSGLVLPILATNSSPLEGFTLSVQFPSDRLSVSTWTIAGTITETVGAEFAQLASGTNWLTAQVLLDAVGPFASQTIPAGTDTTIARPVFAVAPTVVEGETRSISFVDGLGSPAVVNTLRIDGLDQPPVTDGATITFLSQPSFIRGDCNGDNTSNIVDAVFELAYMFAGGLPPPCFKACDVNDDAALNIVDAVGLLYYLFVPASPPPAMPFPTAGPDPTPDALTCG